MGKNISKEKEKIKFIDALIILISTGIYTGFLPFAPATVGALLAIPIFLWLGRCFYTFASFTFIFFVFSVWIVSKSEKILGKDSRKITIDEISGLLFAYLFFNPSLILILFGFLLFRLIDILKPWPLKLMEGLKGVIGVVLDDVIAGIGTNLILRGTIEVLKWQM